MPDRTSPPTFIRFDEFEFDEEAGCLLRRGVKTRLRGQVSEILSLLLERAGEVVSREDLRKRLWPGDVIVDFEVNLNTAIAQLREALGDSAEHPRYIETLPKRGYRFLAPVSTGQTAGIAPERRIRLLVLPLSNEGGTVEEYFSDAMTDEIITALCQIRPDRLAVIARTTAMHYKNNPKDVAQIGRELGVDFIVEGVVRRIDDRVAMTVRLAQVADQTHLLAKKYDFELPDLFRTVDRAASELAEGIGMSPAPPERPGGAPAGARLHKEPTESLAAYNDYIQARFEMGKGSREGFAAARRHLEGAIARDPGFALAHDSLAEIDWYLGYFGYVPPRKAFSSGIVHALRAIEIDSSRAETHALLGEFHKTLEYNWPEVHREMALALALDPASPLVRLRYSVSELMPHGRLEEAIAELKRALEIDPLSLLTQAWLGIMLLLAHKWDLAIDQAQLLLRHYPSAFWGHYVMGVAFRETGEFEKAIAALHKATEISGMPGLVGWLGLALGMSGNTDEARSLLGRLQERSAEGYVPPTSFAWIHLGLGELDNAFMWMDRAVEECDQLMMPVKSYKFLDPIRGDPRYLALLGKMNLLAQPPARI